MAHADLELSVLPTALTSAEVTKVPGLLSVIVANLGRGSEARRQMRYLCNFKDC